MTITLLAIVLLYTFYLVWAVYFRTNTFFSKDTQRVEFDKNFGLNLD